MEPSSRPSYRWRTQLQFVAELCGPARGCRYAGWISQECIECITQSRVNVKGRPGTEHVQAQTRGLQLLVASGCEQVKRTC